MQRKVLCAVFVALAACGDDAKQPLHDDAGPADAALDVGSARITGCLDTPGVATAPAGELPCDLVPPGRQL